MDRLDKQMIQLHFKGIELQCSNLCKTKFIAIKIGIEITLWNYKLSVQYLNTGFCSIFVLL